MRVAIYIRVSTDEQAASAEEQERGARQWCARKEHEVVAVYRDVGHSGAEWVHRAGVIALRADATRKPRPYELVVVRDADRLGRDAIRLPELLVALSDRGVKAVAWSTDEALGVEGGVAKLIMGVRASIAEIERENIAHRTRTAHRSRVERGLVVGCAVFGYEHERAPDGVRYVIDEREAAIVREMFERAAGGASVRAITRWLNASGVPSPRAGGAWEAGRVGKILRSTRYKGFARWGASGAEYRDGTRRTSARADALTYEVPAIVDAATWERAQARADGNRREAGLAPLRGRESRHLLVGLAYCASCKKPIGSARTRQSGAKVPAYTCVTRRKLGAEACEAMWCRWTRLIDAAVLGWLAEHALSDDTLAQAVEHARDLAREASDGRRERDLEATERDLASRVAKLRAAVEVADDVASVVAALRERTRELAEVREERARQATPRVFDLGVERDILAAARVVRGALLDRHPADARAILAAVLSGRIAVAYQGPRRPLLLTGEVSVAAVFSLTVGAPGFVPNPLGLGTNPGADLGCIPLRIAV